MAVAMLFHAYSMPRLAHAHISRRPSPRHLLATCPVPVAQEFTFDYSYWSHDGFTEREGDGYLVADPGSKYADQNKVMSDLGMGVLENAWGGYHSTVFAYGQTGSGKSYSIVGYGSNKGVIPMTCAEMFRRIESQQTGDVQFQARALVRRIRRVRRWHS